MKLKAAHFIFALFIFYCGSAHGLAPKQVTLSGTIKNPKGKSVYLSKYENYISYEKITIDSASLDAEGNFNMTFVWEEAGEAMFFHGNEMANLYLYPGNVLHMSLNTEEFDESIVFSGKGASVNNYKAQFYLFKEGRRRGTERLSEDSYVKITDSLLQADLGFTENYIKKSGDLGPLERAFFEEKKNEIIYSWAVDKMQYPGMHAYMKGLKDRIEPNAGYYDFLNDLQTSGEGIPGNQYYIRFAQEYIRKLGLEQLKNDSLLRKVPYEALYFNIAKDRFTGKTKVVLLASYLHDAMIYGTGIETAELLLEDFGKEAKDWPDLSNVVNKTYKKVLPLKAGKPAPNFSAISITGEKISLSDFKGKVVYVDVWASWCGPCIMEIPSAKKLDSTFKGKDVVFLNISVDGSTESWLKALEKYEIEGINAIAEGAFDSDIAKAYMIQGIPHYILIDKEGKIISSNAGRPSGNAAKEIEAALAE